MFGVVTSAWYMMLSLLQFPSIGHVVALRQLQFFLSTSVDLDLTISGLLWLFIIVLMLLMQL